MNLSCSIMLVDKNVRPLRVEYDPDNKYNNNPMVVFKTIDKNVKKGDLVIVQTNTRHGFTIAKVTEIDFAVDFNSGQQWGWCGGKFDAEKFKELLTVEEGVISKVAKAQENKARRELKEAMGIDDSEFSPMDLAALGAPPTTPAGVIEEAPAPIPAPPRSAKDDKIDF